MIASDKKRKEIVLRVQDPDPSHVGRNIVTLSRKAKEELEITSGDIVEIEATKKTAAVVWPARPEDEGKDIIRMDSLIRRNAGVGLGEKVTIRKAHVEEAKKVVERLYTLVPPQLFPVKIQGVAVGRILSSKTISALKKDVTGYLYGGDITRKRKLWEKQKKGKKKLKERGKVNIPHDVFLKMVKNN